MDWSLKYCSHLSTLPTSSSNFHLCLRASRYSMAFLSLVSRTPKRSCGFAFQRRTLPSSDAESTKRASEVYIADRTLEQKDNEMRGNRFNTPYKIKKRTAAFSYYDSFRLLYRVRHPLSTSSLFDPTPRSRILSQSATSHTMLLQRRVLCISVV